jgi:hypothetical protein
MSKEARRWIAGAFGFAAAVIGTTVGLQAALICLLGSALCAGIVIARERGAVGRLTAAAGGIQKKLEAHAQATRRPASTPSRRPRQKPQTSRPRAAQVTRPYDHDEASGEHVFEVASYGW